MAQAFPELVIKGVLLAPFVTYLVMALVVIIVLRPLLHVVGFAKVFRFKLPNSGLESCATNAPTMNGLP
jgi:hypothetical protein